MTGAKRSLLAHQRRVAGIPAYASDLRLVRGGCLNRIRRKRCPSRWGIVRLSIDFRSRADRDTIATVECAMCGATWHRTRPPERLGEYQSCRLTLILPADQNRWFARGRWHVEGSDGIVIADASWADLMTASAEWKKRHDQLGAALAKKAAKKADALTAQHAATMATLASWAERDEARAADEAAATLRDLAS